MGRTILCYGDSNTWGYVPLDFSKEITAIQRYPRHARWPGVLQKFLGEKFHIVEEGLNSRTTNLDYQIPPDRNGKTYLPSCLYSHAPIDLVILALGSNDLKTYFDRTPAGIRQGLAELIDIIQGSWYGEKMKNAPQILIMSPFKVLFMAEQFKDEHGVFFLKDAGKKSQELVHEYADLANEKNCHFLDVSASIFPSEIDGMHLDESAHQKLAAIISEKVRSIFHE
ncbi:MAG TPA: SGNH/GDSL hydrolase family protein [Gammaproteobacteria bacterium]|nr:SGNH/GDSL hydrolase family protein [Gammaproteobacteria bacterium]